MDYSAEKAIEVIDQQLSQLALIVLQVAKDQDCAAARERLGRWKARTVGLLQKHVTSTESRKLAQKQKWVGYANPLKDVNYEADMYRSFLLALREAIGEYPEEVLYETVPQGDMKVLSTERSPVATRSVFVIHGHDELNLRRLTDMLVRDWKLEALVLSAEAGKGRTLIEKFEQEATKAAFALALFTPDDFIAKEDEKYGQARPNVVFELGWFYGKLTRERVCILFKRGTKIHSDLDGISRIEFDESVQETALALERELRSAGLLRD